MIACCRTVELRKQAEMSISSWVLAVENSASAVVPTTTLRNRIACVESSRRKFSSNVGENIFMGLNNVFEETRATTVFRYK